MYPQQDVTKLTSAVDKLEGKHVIQMDLDRCNKWTSVNLMKFIKVKCTDWLMIHPVEVIHFGVLVDEKLDLKQQYALTAQKANSILC